MESKVPGVPGRVRISPTIVGLDAYQSVPGLEDLPHIRVLYEILGEFKLELPSSNA